MEIRLEQVRFGYRRADNPVFDGIDLAVGSGRTVLLGPNGAGKSTLLALVATAIRPRSGRLTLDEIDPWSRGRLADARRAVAWMPQAVDAASGLSVREHVALHGWLAGMTRTEAWDRSVPALERVGLTGLLERRAAKLSGGQKARMGLAQALVRDARAILLDEPTAALDPDQREAFIKILAEVSLDRTVLVSTHDVGDLSDQFDQVVVLDRGRIRFEGSTQDFLRSGDRTLTPVEAYRRAVGVEC